MNPVRRKCQYFRPVTFFFVALPFLLSYVLMQLLLRTYAPRACVSTQQKDVTKIFRYMRSSKKSYKAAKVLIPPIS